jgi:hypothetical protein
MAKRFTDTQKWQDEWFMNLPQHYKLLYLYILDACDHAGIWKINLKLASFHIGFEFNMNEVSEAFAGKIIEFKQGYMHVLKFVDFQYNGIKNDAVGKSIIKILHAHNLVGATKGLPSPSVGTKDKDKDKDMVKVKDKVSSSMYEGGVGGENIDIDKCMEEAKKDFRWTFKAQATDAELEAFNEHLTLQGIHSKESVMDYKKHFVNWKAKKPAVLTKIKIQNRDDSW